MIRIAAKVPSSFSRGQFLIQRRPNLPTAAFFATNHSPTSDNKEWRKQQLENLENKFQSNKTTPLPINEITSDDELQPMWKEMESRVIKRKTLTKQQAGNKTGRQNVKKTDEEAWLQAGLYDCSNDDNKENGDSENESK